MKKLIKKFLNNLAIKRRIKRRLKAIKKYEKNGNIIKIHEEDLIKVNLYLENCQNNYIEIKKLSPKAGKISISMFADNSKITIGENYYTIDSSFIVGQDHPNFGKINNVEISIGDNTSSENDFSIITYNSNSSVKIGNKCMFAFGITLFNTDAHPVYDLETNEIINKVDTLEIQDNVWIGAKSTILKNCFIPKGCLVGWNSVVAKRFSKENCAIAGNPAKVIKENVYWNSNGSQGYIQNDRQTDRQKVEILIHLNLLLFTPKYLPSFFLAV